MPQYSPFPLAFSINHLPVTLPATSVRIWRTSRRALTALPPVTLLARVTVPPPVPSRQTPLAPLAGSVLAVISPLVVQLPDGGAVLRLSVILTVRPVSTRHSWALCASS